MQVVAYDEDHSERQRIMEKVRTRSSTIALASSNSGSQLKSSDSAAWKGDQKLGRLFKAAEANKWNRDKDYWRFWTSQIKASNNKPSLHIQVLIGSPVIEELGLLV